MLALLALLGLGLGLWARQRRHRPRRRQERQTCYKPVRVRRGKVEFAGIIVDFTEVGIKLKHDGELSKARNIRLLLDGQWLRLKVRWRNSSYVGAKLHRRLNDRQVELLRNAEPGQQAAGTVA